MAEAGCRAAALLKKYEDAPDAELIRQGVRVDV